MARGLVGLFLVVLTCMAGQAAAARPLVTAVHEPYTTFAGTDHSVYFDRIAGSGSTAVRIWLDWRATAPTQPSNPGDPNDSAYVWSAVDRDVASARARGLRVLLTFYEAPKWAERGATGRQGSNDPDPAQLGLFAQAAALRYQGQVFDWEIWNEPNLDYFLMPQTDDAGNSLAPTRYRDLVNSAAAAIHAMDVRNRVVAGALAPFGSPTSHMPLNFMRKLLCMSGGTDPKPVCGAQVAFDVWSTHPYTSGGPTHHAYWPDDVSIGDLPEMRRLLRAAIRHGRVSSARSVEFWVTEFSWETNGPDPLGVPPKLHARWTSEALYRMWSSGVSLVTHWLLRDRPFPAAANQSGLYFCGRPDTSDEGTCLANALGDAPKSRTIRAFRFPFVAFPRNGRVFTWGRTPASKPGRVVIHRRTPSGWRRVGVLRTNQYGIFQKTWRIGATRGVWRARLVRNGEASVGFSLRRVPDRPLVHPFGCGGGLPC